MDEFAISKPRAPLGDLPPEISAAIEHARTTQREAIRFARLSAERWREVARMLDAAGASIDEAASLMGVSPRRIRELLES